MTTYMFIEAISQGKPEETQQIHNPLVFPSLGHVEKIVSTSRSHSLLQHTNHFTLAYPFRHLVLSKFCGALRMAH